MNGYHFQNWAKTYECYPEKFFEPTVLDELRSILAVAREHGKKIRMIGCGHSPSDLCLTNDFMVSIKNFNKILNLDEDKKIVTVETGVWLTDLVQFLKEHNLALSLLPAIGEQTMGGVVSVCTHGSGAQFPVMADLVTRLTLLTADGNILECTRDKNSDIFHSALGGLGLLGIILELDFKCEPYYNLKHLRYPLLFDDFVDSVEELCQESHHFKANFFPYVDHVVVSAINRSKLKPIRRPNPLLRKCLDWFWYVFILVYVFEFCYFLALYVPFTVKYINRAIYWLLFSNIDYHVDGYERIAFFNCLFHQYVSEWTVDRSQCGDALRRLRTFILTNNIPAHLPIEIRFIRRDSLWLSPAYERDICAINLIAYCPYEKKQEHEKYWRGFQEIMRSMGGRPHLAKGHRMNAEEMRKAYPRYDDFLRLRRSLDKNNIFMNGYAERLFGICEG